MLEKIKNRQSQAGFTLVELLIVIVVIAILAAIAITAFSGVQANARDAQRQSDIDQVQQTLELYYADNGNFPVTIDLSDPEMSGLGPEAVIAPQAPDATTNSFGTTAPAAGTDVYFYQAYTASDDVTACTAAADCQSYIMRYWSEDEGAVVEVKDVSGE